MVYIVIMTLRGGTKKGYGFIIFVCVCVKLTKRFREHVTRVDEKTVRPRGPARLLQNSVFCT